MMDNHSHTSITTKDTEVSAISRNPNQPATKLSLFYDFFMLFMISIDLLLMLITSILTSNALQSFARWLLDSYQFAILDNALKAFTNQTISVPLIGQFESAHSLFSILGGFFTLFLIYEILIRWGLAIFNKTYYRWFFFPFVHWYEVISCFPQLRIFRLLRAVVIARRLHQMGIKIIPEKWLNTLKFYYNVLLEELSDQVLLTAIANIRTQLNTSIDRQALVKKTIDNNRDNIESMILSMLRTELAPRLRQELMPNREDSPIAKHVGLAVSEAVANTPELKFVLRKIPIAGSMIESQIMGISEKVGYNIADSVNNRLLKDEVLDEVFTSIAHGISQIDTSNPALESLIADIIEESLTAFESQIKIQQWQHHEEMEKMHL